MKQLFAALLLCLLVTSATAKERIFIVTASDRMSEYIAHLIFAEQKYAIVPVRGADGALAVREVERMESTDHLVILLSGNDTFTPWPATLIRAARVASTTLSLVVKRDGPIKSFEDLKAKKNPSVIVFGNGIVYRQAASLLGEIPSLIIIPTTGPTSPGGSPSVNVLGGHVDSAVLALATLKSTPELAALRDFPEKLYIDVAVPKNTEKSRVGWLRSVIRKSLSDPTTIKKLQELGFVPILD